MTGVIDCFAIAIIMVILCESFHNNNFLGCKLRKSPSNRLNSHFFLVLYLLNVRLSPDLFPHFASSQNHSELISTLKLTAGVHHHLKYPI